MVRGPLPLQGGAKPPGRVLAALHILQTMVASLPAEIRLQLAGAVRTWVDEFERQALSDFDRQNPPPAGGPNTYTTSGWSR